MSNRPSDEIPAPQPSVPAAEGTHLTPDDEQTVWRDSSMDLERGLDVVELSVDLVLPLEPDLPKPKPNAHLLGGGSCTKAPHSDADI